MLVQSFFAQVGGSSVQLAEERFKRTRTRRLSAQHWEVLGGQERKSTDWQWRGEPEFMSGSREYGVTELSLRD